MAGALEEGEEGGVCRVSETPKEETVVGLLCADDDFELRLEDAILAGARCLCPATMQVQAWWKWEKETYRCYVGNEICLCKDRLD